MKKLDGALMKKMPGRRFQFHNKNLAGIERMADQHKHKKEHHAKEEQRLRDRLALDESRFIEDAINTLKRNRKDLRNAKDRERYHKRKNR